MSKFSENMSVYWRYVREKVNPLPRIWRVGIFFGGLFLIYLLWQLFFASSLSAKNQQLEAKKTQLEMQIKMAEVKEIQINESIKKIDATKARHETLRFKLQQFSDVVNISGDKIISSEQMAGVLKALLSDVGLSLESLEITPEQTISPSELEVINSDKKLYDKAITISFKGGYFAVLNYVRELEGLSWQLVWDQLEYKVIKYPDASVTLKLYIVGF
jgi:MSHA biogenesis protein MshJ